MEQLIDVDKWFKENNDFINDPRLDIVRIGRKWMDKLARFGSLANHRTFIKVFGEDGDYLWSTFVDECDRDIFRLEGYLRGKNRNELNLCLVLCNDYELYEK